MEVAFASEAHSPGRREIATTFRRYLQERPLQNVIDHLIIDGSFVSEKVDPDDIDVLVGIVPGRLRMLVANQPGLSPKQVLLIIQGGKTRRSGKLRVHAFPYQVGSSDYESLRAYFRTSTRPHEPRDKGVLRVSMRP